MRKHLLTFALFGTLIPSLVHAQATRTWVSGVGDDANPCSRTAPGKTFAGCISKTAPGGVIDVLDPGGFGAVTITKSITIEGDGAEGDILVSGTHGIIIAAGINDIVILRNLTFEGLGTGLAGIDIISAGSVHIENCRINAFTTGGINWVNGITNAQLYVKTTTIHNCGLAGVNLASAAPSTSLLEGVNISDSANGIIVGTNNTAVLVDCTAAGNITNGITINRGADATINRASLTGNTISLQNTGTTVLTGSVITGNESYGIKNIAPGTIRTDDSNINRDGSTGPALKKIPRS